MVIIIDTETNETKTMELSIADILYAIERLEKERARHRGLQRVKTKNYYIPTGRPAGRPKKIREDSPAS